MVNELYLTLVYRPQPTAVGAAALSLLKTADRNGDRVELRDSLDECAKKRQELIASLVATTPSRSASTAQATSCARR